MDEQATLAAATEGDLEAFNRLVLAYQDQAYNLAVWILKEPERAEDITQDAFLQAYTHLGKFRGGSFRAWLLRIVKNAAFDEVRRQKRHKQIPLVQPDRDGEEVDLTETLPDPQGSVEATIEQIELRENLRRGLNRLATDHRAVLVMVDILEMDYTEAAKALQVPIGTVKSRLVRARLSLRKILQDLEETPVFSPVSENTEAFYA